MEKIAFITGSSRGIGRGIAIALAREGYAVGINYIQAKEKADELVAMLRAEGHKAVAVQADVADQLAITTAIRRAEVELGGPISLLVNNAGIAEQHLFQHMGVNLGGARHTIQAVLPRMIHEKDGCIINISSMWGLRGASCEVAYSSTKGALIAMTRSLALEVAPSGIRVNCVAPGVINTDMVQVLGQDTLQELAQMTPVGRLGTAEDIAHAVAFLASDKASFITGQILTADGGFVV